MTTTRVQQLSDGEELVSTSAESGLGEDRDPRDSIPGRRSSILETEPATLSPRGAPAPAKVRGKA
jgi:hypothetical protein